jgi:hypothetical protein
MRQQCSGSGIRASLVSDCANNAIFDNSDGTNTVSFRQDEEFRNVLIIAQSGWGRQQDKNSASKAGFDHHIVEPVAYEALERLLAQPRDLDTGSGRR